MMKKGLITGLALFLLCSCFAQDQIRYKVNLGNFDSNVKAIDFDYLLNKGLLYTQAGQKLVFLGHFEDYNDALQQAQLAKEKGCFNARVEPVNLNKPSEYYVQIASYDYFNQAALSFDYQSSNRKIAGTKGQIQILVGPFADRTSADLNLANLRESYPGAFLAKFRPQEVHLITDFYYDQEQPTLPSPQLTNYQVPQQKGFDDLLAKEEELNTFWELHFGTTLKKQSKPAIRGNKKRTSALKLQTLLKKDGAYTSSLDGYYGKGTQTAFQQMYNQDPVIQYYRKQLKQNQENVIALELNNINDVLLNLPYEPMVCKDKLVKMPEPLAGAYLAYLEMIASGPSNNLNKTMNRAIKEAFKNGSVNQNMRFDPSASYDYQNMEQIVQHLLFIHMNTGKNIPAPCWLYDYHIKEISQFSSKDPISFAKINWNNCSSTYNWEEMDLLLTIINQISIGQVDAYEASNSWSNQITLIYDQPTISDQEHEANQAWSEAVSTNIYKWGQKDVYLEKLSYSIRLLYFQNQVLLEDLFMDKGFSLGESKKMALAAMNSLAGPYLSRFN